MKLFKWMNNSFWETIKFLLLFLGFRYASGHLTVIAGGSKTIKIITGFTPKRVWLCPHSSHGIPTCGGSLDCFDIFIIPDGFVLHVRLQSESREFDWVAEGF